MNPNNKKYGLLMPKKKQGELKSTNVFGDDSDDEDPRAAVNTSIQKSALLSKIKRQTQLEIDNALQDDPTVYEYDSIYDNIQAEKTQKEIDIKQKKDKKPKYIAGLLKAAETRKREDERRTERKVQKEREKEGNEFEDKDVFVTGAYRKKMQEMQELEEKERREAELEALCDVKKQKDMSGFYRYLLKEKTGESVAPDTADSLPQVKTEPTDDKPQRDHRRQRHDSSSSSSSSSSKSSSEERKTHKSSQSHKRERSSEKHNSSRQEKTRSFEMSRSSEDNKHRDRHGDRDRQHRDYKSDSSRHRHSESESGRHRHGDTDSYKHRERYIDSLNRKHENDKERHRNDKGRREEGHSRNSSSGHRSEKYERRRDDNDRRNSKERDQRLKEDRDRKRDRSVSEDGRSEPRSTGKTDDISATRNKETDDSKMVGPAKPTEKKSEKYAKRNTDNSVNDARARYLARKLGKERARPVVQNDNDD